MAIDNPSSWKERHYDFGPKYDKILEMIAQINDNLQANESTYVYTVEASSCGWRSSAIASEGAGTYHRTSTTGSPLLGYVIRPPHWLVKYAVDNSLTLKITNVRVFWEDTNSADYVDRAQIWQKSHDLSGGASILDDPANYGLGTTNTGTGAWINYNVTDTTMVDGDWVFIILTLNQGTANSQRIYSFELTFTLT